MASLSPGLSVVIRTGNSARTLPRVLGQLQPEAGDEIIIVDSQSTDATRALATAAGVMWIDAPMPFHYSSSLNAGISAASQPWVVVLSSHCIPRRPNYLAEWRELLASLPDEVAAVYAPLCLGKNDSPRPARMKIVDRENVGDETLSGGNGNAAYRREWVGRRPFQTDIRTGEDREWAAWAIAQGHRIACAAAPEVLYRNQGSTIHMFRKGFYEVQAAPERGTNVGWLLRDLVINLASLTWKLVRAEIPVTTWWRQGAHAWGALAGRVAMLRRGQAMDFGGPAKDQ